MKIVIFGATGMVGQAALKQALLSDDVEEVLVVGRNALTEQPKLKQMVLTNLAAPDALAQIQGYDACFFCIGATSSGMSEDEYHRFTYDFTLAIAQNLCKHNPAMHFIYISGAGADSSESGKTMWARVRGKTENALAKLPFKAVNNFRPMFIQPVGVESKTASYRWMYRLMTPFFPLIRALSKGALTSIELGNAMLNAVRTGETRKVVEAEEIRKLANASLQNF
ncbi:NAD(P)H-binding protein [Eikenella sp. S3360]|uniref:NAD(P)H-binding protein n=1 Tax=Eikenella glucosivorans TaxID=2766967 RepID=A0ABS0NBB0_9NEIS|nr:NAD(P)H-binding protein [Eikenella glucosivorans]MBH5329582.1 NAD(P)H-binding protein [Eikenella glucosivorans]